MLSREKDDERKELLRMLKEGKLEGIINHLIL